MSLYIETSKESILKKQLKLVNEFSKVAGYKINIKRVLVFLYNAVKLLKINISILFIIASKIIKYFEIHLIKEVQDTH